MQFEDDIQALRRGELDPETLLGRLRAYLRRTGSDPVELRQALDQARRADQITAADYDLLTQCIADASERPPPSAGSPASRDDLDSMTRLATSIDIDDEGQSNVDVGSRLRDRFILDEVIGVGGMGTVYRGRDVLKIEAQDRNPYVAIKILNDSFKQRPDAFIVLQREASRQQRLAHPNIVAVHDFDRAGGVMFMTMEYLDGISLDAFIKQEVRQKGGLTIDEALPIIEGMCSALAHAHARNIVHADFKPGNCFITENRQLKVLDFGIARAMKDPARAAGDETLFDPRSIGALTPAYASPEMLENNADADPRDDVYALACVCYELLSGRHPFHRIPGDQAKANGLKPERIKHLSRRQNDALCRALAFERAERTGSVMEFLDGLRQTTSRTGSIKVAVSIGVAALVVAAAMILPGLLDRWNGDAIIAEISAGNVESGLAMLDDVSRQQYIRVLQESRVEIQTWFERRFEELMRQPDPEVDYPAAERLLAEAAELYPDSAALRELSDRFGQRREAYLSQIAQDFERYLAPEFLLPEAGADDLPDLLARLAVVDPTNPLLEDSRVPGAYADSVDAALQAERYGAAREYLDAGLALAPADVTLADLRDRVVAAEQRLARQAAIARLSGQLEAGAGGADDLADAEALLPVVNELALIDPDNAAIAAAGETLAIRLEPLMEAASNAERLPDVDAYLERARPVWEALAQPQMIDPVTARRNALVDRQEELRTLARQAIGLPEMRLPDGQSAMALITELASIDPADPRPAVLQSELVQVRRERAEADAAEQNWDAARAQLAALGEVPLSPEQRDAVALDLQRIDTAEQRANEQAEAAERLAAVQRQAEQQRQEQERLREIAAQREARIDDAAAALERSLDGFDASRAIAATRDVLDRVNALETLEPAHPLLAEVGSRLDLALEQAVRRQPTTAAGLELIADAEDLLGSTPKLTELRGNLESRLAAEQAAQRRAAVADAEAALSDSLQSRTALATDAGRDTAERALAELARLSSDDPNRLAAARREYVEAHVDAAGRLVDAMRFSVAERVLEAAAAAAGDSLMPSVEAARDGVVAARETFREERARQESQARIEALAQRFNLEVNSGQLTRARQTLAEYAQLDPDGALATGEGALRLADGYHRVARQRLDAGNFDGARALIATGLDVVPGFDALEALGLEVERLSLLAGISAWFGGESDQPAEAMRASMRRYREMDPDDYPNQEVAWAASAERRLNAMTGDREAHNRFLDDARSLLSDQDLLADVAMILPPKPVPRTDPPAEETSVAVVPTPRPSVADLPASPPEQGEPAAAPKLSSNDLLGRWCADNIEIEFQRSRMVFFLDSGEANYTVNGYDVNGDAIYVNWDGGRLGPMIFEFGRFTEARDRMVQVRGRPASDDNWQTYNRDFLRCG